MREREVIDLIDCVDGAGFGLCCGVVWWWWWLIMLTLF